MLKVFKAACKCGKFEFVFAEKPVDPVDVKCPVCQDETKLEKLTEVKVAEEGADH